MSPLAFAVFALLAVSTTAQVKYSQLVDGGHVVDLGMKLSYTSTKETEVSAYNAGAACKLDDETCQTPTFSSADGSTIVIDFKFPAKASTLRSDGDSQLGEATSILFKACYAKPWTVNRKWRKANDVISKDKRCKWKMTKVETTASSAKFQLPSDFPTAQWFVTALVHCPVENSDKTVVCGVDTTGGLGALVKDPEGTSSEEIYFKTEVVESRTTGLYVAVVVLSVASVSLLVGFFVFEQLLRKNK